MADQTNIKRGEHIRKCILDMIIKYIEQHGYAPTIREIGEAVGLKSTSSVMDHVRKMLAEGTLETDAGPGSPRALRVPGYRFVKEDMDELI